MGTVEDTGFEAEDLLNKSRTDALRQRMREFVSNHKGTDEENLRKKVSEGDRLSDIL